MQEIKSHRTREGFDRNLNKERDKGKKIDKETLREGQRKKGEKHPWGKGTSRGGSYPRAKEVGKRSPLHEWERRGEKLSLIRRRK